MSTSKAVKISYTMSPPLDLPIDTSLPVSKSHIFTVPSSSSSSSQSPAHPTTNITSDPTSAPDTNMPESIPVSQNQAEKAYYKSLLVALGEAKQTVGEELTSWRDVIGKREGVVAKPGDEEDADGDGDGEEEE